MGFLLEWKRYLDEIESQSSKDKPFQGKKMDTTVFEKVRVVILWLLAFDFTCTNYTSILSSNGTHTL